jgi:hypothetical protein
MALTEARERLAAAQAGRTAAERKLEACRASTGRARALLGEIDRAVEEHEEAGRQAAEAMRADMKASLAIGAGLSAGQSDLELTKAAAAEVALEARRAAAEQLVGDLTAEENAAREDVEAAHAAVAAAVKGVLQAEAEAIAAKWANAEASLREFRARLGRVNGTVWRLGGISADVSNALVENEKARLDMAEYQAVNAAWTELSANLVRDAGARLDFSALERARDRSRIEATASAKLQAAALASVANMRAEEVDYSWVNRALLDHEAQ